MINVIPDDKLRMRSKRLVADVDNDGIAYRITRSGFNGVFWRFFGF